MTFLARLVSWASCSVSSVQRTGSSPGCGAFADGDKVAAGRADFAITLRLHHKVLHYTVRGDAGGQAFDVCRPMSDLPHVAG